MSRIKPEKPTNLGMFEKIDICESVEEMIFDGESTKENINVSNK